jgi:hypothetical protein
MDRKTFDNSLAGEMPPPELNRALKALWHDANGNWNAAHELAQEQEDPAGSWVHAYLHRKEGDAGNAAYWYRRAGKPVSTQSLEDEWDSLVDALLNESA